MLFSIIIPVYNVEKYLRDCLDSVLAQTYPDWEAVCVNDGSTDGSSVILEEYSSKDSRFKVFNQANGGLSLARNTGLDEAKGDYILFLDSDDWLEMNALETLASITDDEDLVCFSGRRFFEDDHSFRSPDNLSEKQYASGMDYYNDNALQHRDFAFVCVVLRAYKRSYLVKYRLRFKEGIYHEDNLFTPLACYFAEKVRTINECLYDYRVRRASIMASRSLKHWEDIIGIANELSAFFIHKNLTDKSIVYQALTHHYQIAFANVTQTEDKQLLPLVNWKSYKCVSRTKLRHRIQYSALRISPILFRLVNSHL